MGPKSLSVPRSATETRLQGPTPVTPDPSVRFPLKFFWNAFLHIILLDGYTLDGYNVEIIPSHYALFFTL
jgi:hypothetical protein